MVEIFGAWFEFKMIGEYLLMICYLIENESILISELLFLTHQSVKASQIPVKKHK
jgi:hypothetical protein